MRFEKETCDECGEPLRGTYDLIPGTALLAKGEDGEWEYTGTTDVWWDGQVTETEGDEQDEQVWVDDANGHRRLTRRSD